MGKVIDMPTGKKRDSMRRRIKRERKKEVRSSHASGNWCKGVLGRLFRMSVEGMKRVSLSMLSVTLSTFIGFLEVFRRPIRWLLRLIIISMVFAVAAQYRNNWNDLQMTIYAVFTVLFTFGLIAFYDSLINSLRDMNYRLLNRRSSTHA